MKIKKIGAICNGSGVYYLLDQKNTDGDVVCQWLGDGKSTYPLVGLPIMDLENICAMFDITEKKREKLVMRQFDVPDTMSWEDTDSRERQLDDPKLCVRYNGMDLLPLETSAGAFIQEKYLLPLDSLEYMRMCERRSTDGELYIVVKIGMILQAVIMPMYLPDEDFVREPSSLTDRCRTAMKNRALTPKQNSALGQEPGPLFRVYKGTEEVVEEGEEE